MMMISQFVCVCVLISLVLNQGTGKWYEMQDLQVIDILPQMITLSEAYIQASPPACFMNVAQLWIHKLLWKIIIRLTN